MQGLLRPASGEDRVSCLAEPLGLEQAWRRHTASDNYSHKVWQMRTWRFAVAAGIRVVSFDQGFSKFDGVMSTE